MDFTRTSLLRTSVGNAGDKFEESPRARRRGGSMENFYSPEMSSLKLNTSRRLNPNQVSVSPQPHFQGAELAPKSPREAFPAADRRRPARAEQSGGLRKTPEQGHEEQEPDDQKQHRPDPAEGGQAARSPGEVPEPRKSSAEIN